MIDELYNKDILALAANIGRTQRLTDPDATVTKQSPLCGSRIKVDVKIEDGKVADYGQEVRACALGQASAALMAKHVIGQSAEELRAVRGVMLAMLEEGAAAPTGHWSALEVLTPVKDHKARHGAVMLPFDAVVAALDDAS